jgi:hypothetical protein
VEFDFPKVLAWRAKDARRRFAAQRRSGDSSASSGVLKPSSASKYSLRSASTKRLPQAAADTAVQTARAAISLVAPFEGAHEDASLSRPEVSVVAPQKGPMLIPLEGGPPIPLFGNSIVIGRDPDCDLCIASNQVSGKHCELRADGPVWRVVDLGSKNGTQVNGAAVSDQILNPGDELSLARQHRFRINYPGDARFGQGRLAHWLLRGMVAATLALTVYFLWRLIG